MMIRSNIKKTLQPRRVNQEIFLSQARLVWLGQENWVLHWNRGFIRISCHTRSSHVQEWKQKICCFSSLSLVSFPAFRYSWIALRLESISNTFYMHGWKLSRCVNVNQLLIERAISHLCPRVEVSNFSRSTLNEKLVFSRLIKVASLTIFCVTLPSYNFIVSIKDDFYCGYFALRDERWPISGIAR